MICTKCRFITDDDSVFCPRCGEKMESSAEGSEAVARLFKSFNNTVPENGIKLGADVSSPQSKTVDTGSRSDHTSIAGLPPISTNAYVKDPNKIKHNSESEKRIASGNTLDIIKALTGKIIKSVKDDTDRISDVYKDAAEHKLSRSIRKTIRADHAHTQKEITAYKNALRQLEQRLAEFKGQNTLLSQNLDKLWNKLDELMASYDSKVNDLLEYSKRGSLGSSESAYGIKFVNEWKTDIDELKLNFLFLLKKKLFSYILFEFEINDLFCIVIISLLIIDEYKSITPFLILFNKVILLFWTKKDVDSLYQIFIKSLKIENFGKF